MDFHLLSTSVVVLAAQHNPTILHPSFLSSQGISSSDWTLAEPPICTPPFSVVKFSNGIIFTVEENKLQIGDHQPTSPIEKSSVAPLALKYINKLPHVSYRAVGINFSGYYPCADAAKFLIGRFIKSGSWNAQDFRMKSTSLQFVYPIENGTLRVTVDSGKVSKKGEASKIESILIDSNFHVDVPKEDVLKTTSNAIEMFPSRCKQLTETLKKIFN